MLFYAISFLLILLLAYFSKCAKNKDKFFLITTGIYLVIISGLRSISVGVDVANYELLFRKFGNLPFYEIVSVFGSNMFGYRLLAKVVYVMTNGNYQVMLLVCATIIIFGFFKFIYYKSDNCILSVFYFLTLYYYFVTWNVVRQAMAISIALLAILLCDEKKYGKFVFMVLLSMSVHSIALLIFVYLIFQRIHWNKLLFCIYSIIVFIATTLPVYFTKLFIMIFPRYNIYLQRLMDGSVETFFGGEAKGRKIVISISFALFITYSLLCFDESLFMPIKNEKNIVCHNKIIICKKGQKKSSNYLMSLSKESLWVFMAMVMIDVIIGIFYSHNTFYLRVQSLFSNFSIFLIPSVVERMKGKWKQPIYIASILIYSLTTVIRLFLNNSGVYPYRFFFAN